MLISLFGHTCLNFRPRLWLPVHLTTWRTDCPASAGRNVCCATHCCQHIGCVHTRTDIWETFTFLSVLGGSATRIRPKTEMLENSGRSEYSLKRYIPFTCRWRWHNRVVFDSSSWRRSHSCQDATHIPASMRQGNQSLRYSHCVFVTSFVYLSWNKINITILFFTLTICIVIKLT